jgi:hypothetical protein
LLHLSALLRWGFFTLPLGLMGGIFLGAQVGALPGALLTALALFLTFAGSLWLPALAFERWGYRIGPQEVLIRRGVIVHQVTAIPTHRIQHVDTAQGPLDQWLGLARVRIHTASGVGGDGVIPGLRLEDAEALRDRLVEVRGDDGV